MHRKYEYILERFGWVRMYTQRKVLVFFAFSSNFKKITKVEEFFGSLLVSQTVPQSDGRFWRMKEKQKIDSSRRKQQPISFIFWGEKREKKELVGDD